MRPAELDRMLDMSIRADVIAKTYPEDVQGFVNHLALQREMIMWKRTPEAGWRYQTYEDLVFDLASGPRRALISAHEYPEMEARECYYNSWSLASNHPGLTYVEGYAQATALIVRHAWVEDSDGTIIDPTWGGLDLPEGQLGTYFGISFDTEFVLTHSLKSGWTSILESDWRMDFAALRLGFNTDTNGLVTGEKRERDK